MQFHQKKTDASAKMFTTAVVLLNLELLVAFGLSHN